MFRFGFGESLDVIGETKPKLRLHAFVLTFAELQPAAITPVESQTYGLTTACISSSSTAFTLVILLCNPFEVLFSFRRRDAEAALCSVPSADSMSPPSSTEICLSI